MFAFHLTPVRLLVSLRAYIQRLWFHFFVVVELESTLLTIATVSCIDSMNRLDTMSTVLLVVSVADT